MSAPQAIVQGLFMHEAERLNESCACIGLDAAALRHALEHELGEAGLHAQLARHCPHVFAALPVFVSSAQALQMARVIAAVDSVVALPAYRAAVLGAAPPIARHAPGGAGGVFFGYDFHVGPQGVALIEINTNAGGAMLNAALARAQRACCLESAHALEPASAPGAERRIMDMFHAEWQRSRGAAPWRTVAIVDDDPQAQYLYPEFLLFARLFARHGLRAVIADPAELAFRDGRLWHGDTAIDLVYNRLTDFMLEAASSAALRDAYLAGAVVLTPHPQAHALYADKRNLALLSDPARLQALGVPEATRALLADAIPRTEVVAAADAEDLWRRRRQLFFKPVAGFGGRAAYRGDKLTRRVWQDILAGQYVAQALVAPGERAAGDAADAFKFDVRNYAYDGAVQGVAARLYRGQTTNFRTPGGGFAPVYRSTGPTPAQSCCSVTSRCADSASGGHLLLM